MLLTASRNSRMKPQYSEATSDLLPGQTAEGGLHFYTLLVNILGHLAAV